MKKVKINSYRGDWYFTVLDNDIRVFSSSTKKSLCSSRNKEFGVVKDVSPVQGYQEKINVRRF